MKSLLRFAFVALVASVLVACGKSPLDQDLAAYAKVNREIRALENEARNDKLVVPEQYRVGRELEKMQNLIEQSKAKLDALQMQDAQMRKHVKAISNGYQAWLDLLPRVRVAVRNEDAGQLNRLKAEMNSVEEEVRTAEKGIFEFARIKGYKVEQ